MKHFEIRGIHHKSVLASERNKTLIISRFVCTYKVFFPSDVAIFRAPKTGRVTSCRIIKFKDSQNCYAFDELEYWCVWREREIERGIFMQINAALDARWCVSGNSWKNSEFVFDMIANIKNASIRCNMQYNYYFNLLLLVILLFFISYRIIDFIQTCDFL